MIDPFKEFEESKICREIYGGDPPPAQAPNDHCAWNKWQGLWMETDDHLFERTKRRMKNGQ